MIPALLLAVGALARDDGTCAAWRAATTLGSAHSDELTEVSGLVASHLDPGLLWLHNDHGGDAALHAADLLGQDRGRFDVLGVEALDWEDLAPGPCPDPAIEPCTCLYLADIGDNDATRGGGEVLRLAEPEAAGAGAWSQVSPLDRLRFTYPDGPHDAETLLVHPDTGEVLVLTKGDPTQAWAFPSTDPGDGDAQVLEQVASFSLADAGAADAEVTGGAVSPRGWRVVLRTDEDLALFSGAFGESLVEVLRREPVLLPTPPPGAGEAVAWSADGRRLYLVGEGARPEIWAVDCASFQTDGEDSWDPLVDCVPGCGCAGGGRGTPWLALSLAGLLARRRGSRAGYLPLP